MWLRFFSKNIMGATQQLAVKRAITRAAEKEMEYGSAARFYVPKFEISLSARLGDIPVVGVGSGTDALILALKALKIGPGDEVIVPAFGCVATASCISWTYATPIFVDIRNSDYAINPDQIGERITSQTKAIIIAHLFGQPTACITEVLGIAKQHGFFVIEDAAQSFGAKIEINGEWKDAGTIGEIGCFSFSSMKLFSTIGNAGAVMVKDPSIREEIRRMRLYGAEVPYYNHPTVGINAKLHEIHAAVLLAKLPFLEYWLEHRRKLASYYMAALSSIGDIVLPQEEKRTKRVWYRYVIRTKKRDPLFEHLQKTLHSAPHLRPMIHYPVPLPYLSAFKSGHSRGSFPTADRISSEVMSLPLNDSMSLEDVDRVCTTIKEFFHYSKNHHFGS